MAKAKIMRLLDAVIPLVCEGRPSRWRMSMGRTPVFALFCIVIYKYATEGLDPPLGIQTILGAGLVYNGVKWFSPAAPKVEGPEQV